MEMMIKELKNPITEKYLAFKNLVFDNNFSWYTNTSTLKEYGTIFYGHSLLERPCMDGFSVSRIRSDYFDDVLEILVEIAKYNNLHIHYFLRMHVNATHNYGGGFACDPHYDHIFPHKNLLIYLNQASGPTVVIDSENRTEEYFHPKEDAIITFEGKHYQYQPNVGERRIVLVATYV